MTRYASVLELIGSTPIVDVSALSPKANVAIWAKLEGRNPAGSVKDRVALSLVDAAEADGRLVRGAAGQTLIEPSSGNTGIALAMVCRLRGYHLKVVLPTNVSIERRQLLEVCVLRRRRVEACAAEPAGRSEPALFPAPHPTQPPGERQRRREQGLALMAGGGKGGRR